MSAIPAGERARVAGILRGWGRGAWLGGAILGGFALMAMLAPLIAPYDPYASVGRPLERPSRDHALGTNDIGGDILSELLYGARVSVGVAVGAAFGTVLLAALVGGMAGMLDGPVDAALMRTVDVMLAIPRLPLLILMAAMLGAGAGQTTLMIALLFWPSLARVLRVEIQRLRLRPYIGMARHFGATRLDVFRRHIVPQLVPLLVFGLVTAAGSAAAMEAGLAFLGLGDTQARSWGLMMRFAFDLPGLLLTDRWLWWLLPPAACIALLILGLTMVGNAIEARLMGRAG
jgi:peptide/nickel transport system permease protein